MSQREPLKHPSATAIRLAHSIADVAKITGVGRSFIYEEIKAGRLIVKKAGRRSLVFDADLKAWLASLPAKSPSNSKLNPNTH
jgi:excisionase family DNA binding protein